MSFYIRLIAFIIKYLGEINIIKTLYYSLKYKGIILIGKCKLHIRMGGEIKCHSNTCLLLGVHGTTTVPCQIVLNGILFVEGYVDVYRGVKIVVSQKALLKISDGTYVNEYSRIMVENAISLGSHCAISWNVTIMDTDLHRIYAGGKLINRSKEVVIGNNVWIGAYSCIGKGNIIADNTIIGMTTLARNCIDNSYIYAGNPCRVIKPFDRWE